MGVDIHGWVEIKDLGKWHSVFNIEPIMGRNYAMFATLFDIREERNIGIAPVAPYRNLPKDVADITREQFELYEEDAYGVSWIVWEEINQMLKNQKFIDIIDGSWELLFSVMRILSTHYGAKNVRLVVWFLS